MTAATADSAVEATSSRHGRARRRKPALARTFRRLASRVLLPAVLVLALLVVLAYAVFPTRTWLDQHAAIAAAETELAELEIANAELELRKAALVTEVEIERIARKDHGLVRPGEEAYAVLPPAPPAVRIPQAWPFTELARALDP